MFRIILVLLATFLCGICGYAQQSDTAVVYTNVVGQVVAKKQAAFIYRSYQKDSNSFVFETYNSKDEIQKREHYQDVALTIKQGWEVQFKNGRPINKVLYINGKRQGVFVRYDTLGKVVETKSYIADTLNGPSVVYWANGNKLSQGNYLKGERVGTWETYYKNGNLAVRETYADPFSTVKIKNRPLYTDSLFLDLNGNPTRRDQVAKQVSYLGGIEKFYKFISENIKYPQDAQDKLAQGDVHLSFVVSRTGTLEDVQIETTPFPSLGQEALRVLKLCKQWIPAEIGGEKIESILNIPIRFSLN